MFYRSRICWMAIIAATSMIALCDEPASDAEHASVLPADATQVENLPAAKPVVQRKPSVWTDSIGKGFARAQKEGRPVLVRLEGAFCPHCRTMNEKLAEPAVQDELDRWTLIVLDIDKFPAEARQLAVEKIPAFRLLRPTGKLVASEHGVIEPDEFIAWLKRHRDDAAVALPVELTADGEPDEESVAKLIREFRNRDATVREAAIRRLLPYPSTAAAAVVSAFINGNLSTRLSALELLREWKAPAEELDPWRPETLAAEKLQALTDWAGAIDPRSETAKREHLTSDEFAEAKGLLVRIGKVSPAEAVAIRERLARFGPSLLPEVYLQLQAAATDELRERLTAVRYRLAASDALALNWTGGIDRLAAADPEVRHKAADELAQRATPADERLLLELFSDSSALVRELSLRAMKELGGENVSGALLRLLEDPEPNVRAAVLKQLVESPGAAIVPQIARYVRREKDPDLVVHAIRVLREIPGKSALNPLTELLKHESWQVRAEVADALGHAVGRHSSLPEEDKVEIYLTMVGLLEDQEPFVISRAVGVLSQADLVTAVQPLVKAAESHPELAAEIVQALSQGHKQRSAAVFHLRKFCAHENAKVRAAAVAGLCSMQEHGIEEQLQLTLRDAVPDVRIAAATGLFSMFESRRHTWSQSQTDDDTGEAIPAAPEAAGGLLGAVLKLFAPAGDVPTPKAVPVAADAEKSLPPEEKDRVYEQQLRTIREGKLFTKGQHALSEWLFPLLKGEQADERLAGALALQALGHDAVAGPALVEIVDSQPQFASRIAAALPWMLSADRQALWDKLVALAGDSTSLYQLAMTMANVPTQQTERNLWQLAADKKVDAQVAQTVQSAFMAYYFANHQYYLQRLPARDRKIAVKAASEQAASGPTWKRIIALSLLLPVDKEAAGEIARKLLDDADSDPELRGDAFQILLLALDRQDAERLAVERLSAPEAGVRKTALNYLALGPHAVMSLRDGQFSLRSDSYRNDYLNSGSSEPISPAPPAGLTAEAVLPLLKSPDRRTAALAGYLLALLERKEGLDALIEYWSKEQKADTEWTKLVYRAIACLDDSAHVGILKEIYVRMNNENGRHYLREFYWTIRSMTGPEILSLRKTMRDEVGIEQLR